MVQVHGYLALPVKFRPGKHVFGEFTTFCLPDHAYCNQFSPGPPFFDQFAINVLLTYQKTEILTLLTLLV